MYEEDVELLLREAKAAIESTSPGYSVNLVTPASLGKPDSIVEELKREYGEKIMTEYVDQCECGGYGDNFKGIAFERVLSFFHVNLLSFAHEAERL